MARGSFQVIASLFVVATCATACGGKTSDTSGPGQDSAASDDSGNTTYDAIPSDTSSNPDATPIDSPTPDAPTPDAPLPDASIDAPPPDPKVCDDLASAICSSSAGACCTSHGTHYDATICKNGETTYCGDQIALVKSGKLSYDGSQLAACESAWAAMLTKCSMFFIDWVKLWSPCGQLFNGTIDPGGACTYDYQCKAPVGGSAGCSRTSRKCNAYVVVAAGAGCNFSGATIHYCDMGYYCDVTSTTPTCLKQKDLGATCDAPDDLSCGYMNICSSGKCAVGAAAGTACTSSYTCQSWYCDPSTSKCSDPNVELGDPKNGICTP